MYLIYICYEICNAFKAVLIEKNRSGRRRTCSHYYLDTSACSVPNVVEELSHISLIGAGKVAVVDGRIIVG